MATPAGPMHVLGYVRVSTAEQADSGLGLEAQRSAITMECSRRSWNLLELLTDAGVSAKSLRGRPALADALGRLGRGEASALVVSKLDRLSRSLLDFANLMERARSDGWALVALDLGVDTTTPAGEMMANVLASFAHYERRLIGQRTKDALEIRRTLGVRLGRPRAITPEVVERIISDRERGASLRSIADALTFEGVPTVHGGVRWYASTVREILRSSGTALAHGEES
jgi:DNA invertase Pin-like site-specific DNA recombinase